MLNRLLLILASLLATPVFAAMEWFVAPNGHDTNAGTQEKPFATFERARDAMRQLPNGFRISEIVSAIAAISPSARA